MTELAQSLAENAKRLDPAFPMHIPGHFYAHVLSKRELFAAMSMQGLRSSGHDWRSHDVAGQAVKDADALIAALAGDEK